jgi:hexosaminidase
MPLPRFFRNGGGRLPLLGVGPKIVGTTTPRLTRAVSRFHSQLETAIGAPCSDQFPLQINCKPSPECYRLEIGPTSVRIDSSQEWGALRALATLIQLLNSDEEGFYLSHIVLEDEPRFAWRGLMVDVARHFIKIETLERTLDVMAFYKLNVLHLHLSDDQGFRFCGSAYPELADVNACYTARELESLVHYAADCGIRIVPELDVPGHVTSWLAAHPEWGLGETVSEPSIRFGKHECCLDPTNPEVVQAVSVLFRELAQVFPDAYMHFGGDEVFINGIDDIAATQARFNVIIVDVLHELDKTPVAWDEVVHPDLSRDVVVQSWRGHNALEGALISGFDTIYSAPYYIDLFYPADLHYLQDPDGAGPDPVTDIRLAHVRDGIVAMNEVWRALSEVPAEPKKNGRGSILGAEACMWTELVTDELLDVRVWSRMPAIAERFWSDVSVRDVDDMYRRLSESHLVLARTGLVNLEATTQRHLARFGLNPKEIRGLIPLIEMLEPVKWYARLLGEAAIGSRVTGVPENPADRPYDTLTQLNRIIDIIPPESLATRSFEREHNELKLRETSIRWRQQREWVNDCSDRYPAIAELNEISAILFLLSEQLALYLDGGDASVPELALEPEGEYMLPVAQHLVERFS